MLSHLKLYLSIPMLLEVNGWTNAFRWTLNTPCSKFTSIQPHGDSYAKPVRYFVIFDPFLLPCCSFSSSQEYMSDFFPSSSVTSFLSRWWPHLLLFKAVRDCLEGSEISSSLSSPPPLNLSAFTYLLSPDRKNMFPHPNWHPAFGLASANF